MATPRKPKARTTPAKRTTTRTTPAKRPAVRKVPVAVQPVEVVFDPGKGLSPKQIDVVRAASGWKMSDLFDGDEPTGKLMAARMWLAIREHRPDLTPNDLYDHDIADFSDLGIEMVAAETAENPTNAAG